LAELAVILHIPHSSRIVPDDLRDQFVFSDGELSAELDLMTDAFTDELYSLPGATVLTFPLSRLVVDVERFREDADEPMSEAGMGMIYTRTASGGSLRRTLDPQEIAHLASAYYEPHHEALAREVESELAKYGRGLIVDCHSFPSHPLPCDQDQSVPRPQFCIGTHPFHTPETLARAAVLDLRRMGYSTRINQPYAGTMVPTAFYNKDERVASIMVEVNRSLYMDEVTGAKTGAFDSVKESIRRLLGSIRDFQK
jgi:N-formylglutamate deformylase